MEFIKVWEILQDLVPYQSKKSTSSLLWFCQTFITGAWWQGKDLMPLVRKEAAKDENLIGHTEIAKKRIEGERWFDNDHLIAYSFLERLNALGAAGDRHLAEFAHGS